MKDLPLVDAEQARYPLGRYAAPRDISAAQRNQWIDAIAQVPQRLRAAVADLDAERLETPYREGGWTVRQVVHHLPDSHLNSYCRFRLALTEDEPQIRTYEESAWAELPDGRAAPIQASLTLLDGLHARWVILLRSLDETQWRRAFYHPQLGRVDLASSLGLYAWHGAHHVAQIMALRLRQGW